MFLDFKQLIAILYSDENIKKNANLFSLIDNEKKG